MAVRLSLLVALVVAVAGCGDSSSATMTTAAPRTTTPSTVTMPPSGDSAEGPGSTTTTSTTTTVPLFFLPEFTVVERTDDDVLVVAVAPATYTDIDLQNLVDEVVERFAPVNGLHIIDDEAITQLVLADTVTAAEQAMLDEHYFLRLEEGFRMVFLGPFAEVGEVILGS